MLLLNLTKDERSPYIYKQIYRGLKHQILEKNLRPHTKLPSKRELANDLRVSVNSVANAYEQLLAEGYIYAIERKGYYVEDIAQFSKEITTELEALPFDLKEERSDKTGWLSFSHMTSDVLLFPFHLWTKSQQKAIKYHRDELSEVTHPQGPYHVRQAIAHLIGLNRGVICEPEQIVIGPGTQPLIQQLMNIQPANSVVALENPGYSRFYTLLKKMKLNVKAIDIDRDGIDIGKLDKINAKFAIVTPSHQFPTGKIMPISRRIQLLNWTLQADERYIIEDDYDSEFKYKTDNIPSLQSLDRHNRVIYTGTFSKTLLPSFRISYMVLPPNILRDYKRQYGDFMHASDTLSLLTLYYFIEDGEYRQHLKRMNSHYETKRNVLVKKLVEKFKDRIHIEDIPAGLHFFATFKTTLTYEDIEANAAKEKLELYTLKRFILEEMPLPQKRASVVIGFANIEIKYMDEAIERLYRVIYGKK